jgi:hypothetical protein
MRKFDVFASEVGRWICFRRHDALPLPLHLRHCGPQTCYVAPYAALTSLRVAGEAIYP